MVRVVSWNMDHWRRRGARQQTAAWEYLESLNPDYALLQETVPPPGLPADRRVHRKEGIEGRGKWGSAVVSFAGPIRELVDAQSPYSKKAKRVSLHRTLAGSLAVAEVGKGVVLVSAYGTFEEGYTVTTVHKLLSDLTPLLDSRSTKGVVLAGDLNVSTPVAGAPPATASERPGESRDPGAVRLSWPPDRPATSPSYATQGLSVRGRALPPRSDAAPSQQPRSLADGLRVRKQVPGSACPGLLREGQRGAGPLAVQRSLSDRSRAGRLTEVG